MYNFKKNVKAYIVTYDTVPQQYQIDLYSDITASQTFNEQGYKRRTLHAQNDLHDYAVVNSANPANFSFTTPIPDISTTPILLSLGSGYSTGNILAFDLYIKSDNVTYKLEKCVIEAMAFNLEMNSILTVSISGTAAKLYKFGTEAATIPGTVGPNNRGTYTYIRRLNITIGGQILDSIAAIHMDLRNEISWSMYKTIHDALTGSIMYPNSYVLEGRTLAGSITQFVTSANIDTISDTSTVLPIIINIYGGVSDSVPLLQFSLPSTVFTRRLNMEELINRVYDFRLSYNSAATVEPKYKSVLGTALDFRSPVNSSLVPLT